MKDRPITIAKIDSGIVIDHIPSGQGFSNFSGSGTKRPSQENRRHHSNWYKFRISIPDQKGHYQSRKLEPDS